LVQRYICRVCNYRFSGILILSFDTDIDVKHQVGVTGNGAKNLIVAKEEKMATGEISDAEKLLTAYLFYLKERGNKDVTIERRIRYLKELAKKGADLTVPEQVKKVLAEISWVGKSKNNTADAYTLFLKMLGKSWDKPHFQEVRRLPFVPTEDEIDALISGSGWKTAIFLQLMKETAMRPGEASSLRWDDVDFVSNTVRVTPEKGSNPRIFRMSEKLTRMLLNIKEKNNVRDKNRVFAKQLRHIRRQFEHVRKKQAFKLQNNRLLKVKLKTFRTWKATTLYHKTKDPWYVMEFLGHRDLQHTRKYVVLEAAIYNSGADNFVSKVAKTVDETRELIELGFDYVHEIEGIHLYRRRK